MTTLFPRNPTLRERLSLWWKSYKQKRSDARWTPEMQMNHLRLMLQQDARWMAHVKTIAAVTERYERALDPQWFRMVHLSSDKFREHLGLNPNSEAESWKTGNGRVLHVKSGGVYRVLEIGKMENDLTSVVVYKSEDNGQVWVRPLAEFADGRFVTYEPNLHSPPEGGSNA